MNRRVFLVTAAASVTRMTAQTPEVPAVIRDLKPMTGGIQPITDDERHARIEKARKLMHENRLGAIFLEGGSSMFYFTGTRWAATDRTFGLVIPANGEPAWIVPAADESRAHEAIKMFKDVRLWKEDEGPFKPTISLLKDRGVTMGALASRNACDSPCSMDCAERRLRSNSRAPIRSRPDAV